MRNLFIKISSYIKSYISNLILYYSIISLSVSYTCLQRFIRDANQLSSSEYPGSLEVSQ